MERLSLREVALAFIQAVRTCCQGRNRDGKGFAVGVLVGIAIGVGVGVGEALGVGAGVAATLKPIGCQRISSLLKH